MSDERGRGGVEPWVDPAEDAASMASLALAPGVERIARELRARHLAQRMAETEETSRTKVAKWTRGVCSPQGGGHRK